MVSSPSLKGPGPPPPLPLSVTKALRAKKANTKLKRSMHMGNLYRLLKGNVEGSSLDGRASNTRTSAKGSACNTQGMADALAEMTKRSAYFRLIEEDVEKYAASILDLKSSITTFPSKNMAELLKFHQYVEQCLECLTDETQVLARFEGFPSKKLETIRMAAELHLKLDTIIMTLKNWKLMPPVVRQLDKVECYFNRVKEEVDVIERNKEEESKRFQSQNIAFDFSNLLGIKESMVDLSSNCIEMVLKERKEAKEMA
ncbi:uncharacterized protein At4g04980-like isoform X1 [Typha latifolia]|uniref:uncharacterized protein At4g04980-like isoform X1 n=1 Tax=Typha latifolia TaxID=4733 RepID=UPI003C2B9E89